MSSICDCGKPLDGPETLRQQERLPTHVKCLGCEGMLHIRGPEACSHDAPTCWLFEAACSHRLFKMHTP